jgi:hypothetical protein
VITIRRAARAQSTAQSERIRRWLVANRRICEADKAEELERKRLIGYARVSTYGQTLKVGMLGRHDRLKPASKRSMCRPTRKWNRGHY